MFEGRCNAHTSPLSYTHAHAHLSLLSYTPAHAHRLSSLVFSFLFWGTQCLNIFLICFIFYIQIYIQTAFGNANGLSSSTRVKIRTVWRRNCRQSRRSSYLPRRYVCQRMPSSIRAQNPCRLAAARQHRSVMPNVNSLTTSIDDTFLLPPAMTTRRCASVTFSRPFLSPLSPLAS